jgi:predicted MPP superfamily phosphohydrolase
MLMILAWSGAIVGPVAGVWLWRRRARLTLALLAFLYVLGVWAFIVEPETLTVRHVAVESAAWRGPPVVLGVISDTHVGDPHVDAARVQRIVARLNRERPDVALFLGDYVGGHTPAAARTGRERSDLAEGLAAVAGATAPLGRYAVLGNHDWWYDGPAVEATLRSRGIPVLENDAVRVARPGGAFWIAGLADLHSERAQPHPGLALRAVPAAEPVIVLTHWPDPWPSIPPRVALTIAAHSHCG